MVVATCGNLVLLHWRFEVKKRIRIMFLLTNYLQNRRRFTCKNGDFFVAIAYDFCVQHDVDE